MVSLSLLLNFDIKNYFPHVLMVNINCIFEKRIQHHSSFHNNIIIENNLKDSNKHI